MEDSERAAGDSEGVDREAKGTMSRRGVLHRTDARSLTLSRHGADALTVYSAISPPLMSLLTETAGANGDWLGSALLSIPRHHMGNHTI